MPVPDDTGPVEFEFPDFSRMSRFKLQVIDYFYAEYSDFIAFDR